MCCFNMTFHFRGCLCCCWMVSQSFWCFWCGSLTSLTEIMWTEHFNQLYSYNSYCDSESGDVGWSVHQLCWCWAAPLCKIVDFLLTWTLIIVHNLTDNGGVSWCFTRVLLIFGSAVMGVQSTGENPQLHCWALEWVGVTGNPSSPLSSYRVWYSSPVCSVYCLQFCFQ